MSFRVVLIKPGPNVIEIIKIIRVFNNFNLREAKYLIDTAPQIIARGLTHIDALELQNKIIKISGDAVIEDDIIMDEFRKLDFKPKPDESDYSVILRQFGPQKHQVISIIRSVKYISIQELNNFSNQGYTISNLNECEANFLILKLEQVGAVAKIIQSETKPYNVVLMEPDYKRLPDFIFLIEGKTSPDGMEIRDFVECLPYTVRYKLTLSEAEAFADKLKKLGGKVKIIDTSK